MSTHLPGLEDHLDPTDGSLDTHNPPAPPRLEGRRVSFDLHRLFLDGEDTNIVCTCREMLTTHEILLDGGLLEFIEKAAVKRHREAHQDSVCGLCGQPGANKVPHPIRWPGEAIPATAFVHAECEQKECERARSQMTEQQARDFLKSI